MPHVSTNALQDNCRGDTFYWPWPSLYFEASYRERCFGSLTEPQLLSAKWTEMPRFVAGGYSNKEISDALHNCMASSS